MDYLCFVICLVVLMGILFIFIMIYDFIVVGEDGLMYELIEYFVFFCVMLGFYVIWLVDGNEIVEVYCYVFI